MPIPIRLDSSGEPYLKDIPADNIAHITYQDFSIGDIGDPITMLYTTKKHDLVSGINRIYDTNLTWSDLEGKTHTFFHPDAATIFISLAFDVVGEYYIAQKVSGGNVLPKIAKTATSVYEMATKTTRPAEDTVYYTTPSNVGIFTTFLDSQFCTQGMLFSPAHNVHYSFVLLPNNDFLTPVVLQNYGNENGYVTLLFKDEIIPAIDLDMSIYNRPKAINTLASLLQIPSNGVSFTGQDTIKAFDPITGVNEKYTVFCMKRGGDSKYMAVGTAVVVGLDTPTTPTPVPVPTPNPIPNPTPVPPPVEPGVTYHPTGLHADYPGTGWYKATDTGIVFCKDVPENEVGLFEVDGIEYVSVYTKEDAKLHSAAAATSNITDMSSLFSNDTAPNEDISSWDVSNVTDMSNMFYGCISFNQDISGWDTSSVYAMTSMFHGCGTFNQDLSGWNVTRQKTQPYSFDKYAMAWTLPKPVWGTDGTGEPGEPGEPVEPVEPEVTYHPTGLHADYPGTGWYRASDTGTVFCKDIPDGETAQFEEGGTEYVAVYSSYHAKFYGARAATSNMTDMNSLFANNTTFNEDISSWDVSNVTLMSGMFRESPAFNADISNWDVSNVTNMYMMFRKCTSFNQDLSGWNVSNVTTMVYMFYNCTVFNQDLSGWNVVNIPTLPNHFDTNTIAWTLPKPVWGTTGEEIPI